MISFAQSEYLILLLFLPFVLWGIFLVHRRSLRVLRLAFVKHSPYNKQIALGKTFLRIISLLALFLALLGPYTHSSNTVPMVGREIYFLLDVSGSMQTQDISPSRLYKAKRIIRQLIQKLQGNKMGLIVFSDDAYLQCPLTLDYEMLELYLQLAGTQQFSQEGTQFRPVLSSALEHLVFKGNSSESGNQAVVLISDGEDHGDAYTSILDRFKKNHIKIFAIGIGTQQGALVPQFQSKNYLLDENGGRVHSTLQDSSLKVMAKSSGTSYLAISQTYQSADLVFEQIDQQLMAPIDRERLVAQHTLHEPLLLIALFTLMLNLFLFPVTPKPSPL